MRRSAVYAKATACQGKMAATKGRKVSAAAPQPFVDLTCLAKPLYLADQLPTPVDLKDIKAIIDLMRKNDLSGDTRQRLGNKPTQVRPYFSDNLRRIQL